MSKFDELGELIGRRVAMLQATYLDHQSAAASATLAQLRRGVGKPVGTVPEIWEITLEGIPGQAKDNVPSVEEHASHAALTLYAVHQQARAEPMHVQGVGLGTAVRKLAAARTEVHKDANQDENQAVRKRFDAAATSATFSELTYHLRGLISQLRSAGIGLDYGQLTIDLAQAQSPDGLKAVRFRWGHSYYQKYFTNTETDIGIQDAWTFPASDIQTRESK